MTTVESPLPIPSSRGRADDPEDRAACRDLVTAELEARIAALRADGDEDSHRALLPRVGDAVRDFLPMDVRRPVASCPDKGAPT